MTSDTQWIEMPSDLSERAVKLLRHLQALEDGKYIIVFEKTGQNTRWQISVERRDRVIEKRVIS